MPTVLKLTMTVVVIIANSFLICCEDIDQEALTHIYKNLLDTEHFNLEYLAKEYTKVCPFDIDDYRLGKCPNCSYGQDCIINNKCCPDVIYGYLDYKCVSVVQRKGKSWFNATSYSMIASCPRSSDGSGRPSLSSKEEIPVTSLTTVLTYQTKQFAKCNDDDNALVAWNTTFHCLETLPPWGEPVQINTFEELVRNIELYYCEIRLSITAATVPRAAVCSGGEEYYNNKIFLKPKRLVHECNMTGLWEQFDPNIEFACRRLTLKYRYYKNVFCYICNPGLSFRYYKTKPVISTCNWIESDLDIKNACTTREQTPYYLPYKNVFCKLCNIMPDSFFSVNDEVYGTWVHVTNISEQTVAETVGGLFHSKNSNDSFYFDTELIGNIRYNSTNYSCLIPLQKKNGSAQSNARKISNCERSNTKKQNDAYDAEVPFYNCSSMFQNYLINTKGGFNVYNRSLITETLYFSYMLYIYLCVESVEINRFCEVVTEQQICSLKSNQSERAISCMLCQTGDRYFLDDHYRGSGFDVLMKITCSTLLENFLFLNVISLLVAARESGCSIWFVPTGIRNSDYSELITERNDCWDLPFIDSKTCNTDFGTYYFGSYRKLFSLLNNDWEAVLHFEKRVSVEITQCAENVASSTNHTDDSCREILCSEGHVLVNDSCINEYDTYGNMLYELSYRSVVETVLFGDGSATPADGINFASINITDICVGIQGIMRGQINENNSYSFQACEVKIGLNCSGDYIANIVVGSKLEISLSILIYFTKELSVIEKTLVDSLTQSFVFSIVRGSIVTLTITPFDLRLRNTIHPRCSVRLAHETAASFISKLVIVNKLLICPQIELLKHEYIIDNASDTLQLIKNKLQVQTYFIRGGRVRICLDDFNTYLEVTVSIPLLQRIYKVVDNVCTILSLFCLLITFITYCVFQSLRNVPGINNMNLTVSLFCAQLTLKLGIWQPVDSTLCPVFGILIHFFWLSTFFAMNVCSLHMYRVFSSNTVTLSIFTRKTSVLYLLYTYLSPTSIILLTVGSHLAISEGHYFGYGKTTCFLTDNVTVIVSFICPCVFVFLLNILFFVKTFLSIRRTISTSLLRRSTDRRDFLIYVRLWTLLGVTWPLLILDALLEMSVFSFLALTFNTLQGVFIFISFICNKRVLTKYRNCCSE